MEITWSSSNGSVVTCDSGKLVAVGVGNAVIKASIDGGNSTSLMVTVKESTAGVRSMLVGDTASLVGGGYDALFEEGEGVWISDNPEVATADDGRLTALSEGKANIKIASGESSVSVCTVYVYESVEAAVDFADLETPVTVEYSKGGTAAEIYGFECEITDDGYFYSNMSYVSFTVKYRKIADEAGDDGKSDCNFTVELHSGETGHCNTYLLKINGASVGTEGEYSAGFYADLSKGPRTFYLVVKEVE